MDNEAYRKSRGTDKPFNGSEEQTQAIWNAEIRKERLPCRKPNPTPPATTKE